MNISIKYNVFLIDLFIDIYKRLRVVNFLRGFIKNAMIIKCTAVECIIRKQKFILLFKSTLMIRRYWFLHILENIACIEQCLLLKMKRKLLEKIDKSYADKLNVIMIKLWFCLNLCKCFRMPAFKLLVTGNTILHSLFPKCLLSCLHSTCPYMTIFF